jgi:hypothetical protein
LARFFCGACWISFLSSRAIEAAAPVLDHLFPIAIQAGTTNTVTAVGKFDPWPPKIWVDAPGIVFKAGTNNGKFSVEIATDAQEGPHLIRAFNEQGASALRFLIVTGGPQVAEAEPNEDYRKPQLVEGFPASINGRLEKSGDVDSFAVELSAGQTLVASLEAFTLASPLDAVLRIVDERGMQVAFNHDGSTLDPFLVWTAKSAGRYVIQVFGFAYPAESAVKFTGSSKCVYRLHLSRGPYVRHTLPLGVQRGIESKLSLVGWNLSPRETLRFDGSNLGSEETQVTLRSKGFDNALSVPVGDGPEAMEQEPNAVASEANHLDLPSAVTGRIGKSGDEDRFTFMASKGQKIVLEVRSASLGFPLDPWLRVEDLKGKELAKNDDSGGSDPRVEWTAPEDGTFVAAVGNVLHRGGTDYLYRLGIRQAVPTVKVTSTESAFVLAPGKTNELKVSVKRLHGFKATLTFVGKNLPDGVTVEPQEVPEKGGDVGLKLVAAPDSRPFSGPIQIVASEDDSGLEHRAVVDLTSSTVNNGVPGGFPRLVIGSTDRIWLTILPVPEAKEGKQQ